MTAARLTFIVRCPCGKGAGVNITRAQADLVDATLILRTLSRDDQQELAAFYAEHRGMGHAPVPGVAEIEPIGSA